MVKVNMTLMIFLFCISCRREVKEDYNFSNSYVNYPDSTFFSFKMDSLFVSLKLDSLNVKDFMGYSQNKPLSEAFVRYIEPKEFNRMEIDTSRIDYKWLNYYACGKLNLKHGVTGYLVLRKSPNVIVRDWFYNLILLNVKNNNLKSMIIASYNGGTFPEITMQKTYINHADYRFLITNIAADGIDGNDHTIDDFWSKIGLLKPKKLKYYYTSFTLDENGFVKSIPLDEDKFPAYLK